MNTNFWWFKVDATGVKDQSLVQLSPSVMESTIAEYIVNPSNRDNLEYVPELIKKIEKKTKNNIPGSDDWDDEKFNKFKEYLEQSFRKVLDSEVRDLVNKHIDSNEELFKQLKASKETIKLKDLLDSSDARDFSGATLSLDKDLTSKQEELLSGEKIYPNKEFFKGAEIKLEKRRDDKQVVSIELNRELGSYAKSLFKEAFPKSSLSVIKNTAKTTYGYASTSRSGLTSIETQLKLGDWSALTNPVKAATKYYDLLKNPHKATTITDKERIKQLRQWAIETNLSKVEVDKRPIAIMNQILVFISRDKKIGTKSKDLLMSRFNIKLDKSEAEKLDDGVKGDESKIKEFVKDIIDNGKLYKQLREAHKMNASLTNMSKWTITLTFDKDGEKPDKLGTYKLNSHVKEEPKNKIDLSALFTTEGTTRLIKPYIGAGKDQALSGTGSSGKWGFAAKTYFDTGGFNKARDYFVSQVKSNIKNIKKAASKIGLNLEE